MNSTVHAYDFRIGKMLRRTINNKMFIIKIT